MLTCWEDELGAFAAGVPSLNWVGPCARPKISGAGLVPEMIMSWEDLVVAAAKAGVLPEFLAHSCKYPKIGAGFISEQGTAGGRGLEVVVGQVGAFAARASLKSGAVDPWGAA